MDYTIYEFSLFIALPLMLFFGFYFCWPKYRKSHFRKLSALPSDHRDSIAAACRQLFGAFLFGIRFKNANAAILMNLSTYFLCYWLFSSALTTLLDRFYITKRRLRTHISLWVIFPSFPASC